MEVVVGRLNCPLALGVSSFDEVGLIRIPLLLLLYYLPKRARDNVCCEYKQVIVVE